MSSLSPQLVGRSCIRWGMIGCGDVAEVKSGPGFQRAGGSQLVAVMRRNAALAADYARRHGVGRWYDDACALIADPEVDVVYVATPPDTHASYTCAALAAGKPVYCEKPMARHAPECDRMIEAASRAGQKLFVAYYRRYLPRFRLIKELIDERMIGEVTGVRHLHATPPARNAGAGWRVDASASGGGLFLDMGSHALDIIDHIIGPLQEVSGTAGNLGSTALVEDVVAMSFRAGCGVPGAAQWNFASAEPADVLEFRGTEGAVTLSVFGAEAPVLHRGGRRFTLHPPPAPQHVQQPLIQAVVEDLRGHGACLSTGMTARRTSKVMDDVLAGYYGGREDAYWSRPETWPGRVTHPRH